MKNLTLITAITLCPWSASAALDFTPFEDREVERKIRAGANFPQLNVSPIAILPGDRRVEPFHPINSDNSPLTPEYIYDPVSNSLIRTQ